MTPIPEFRVPPHIDQGAIQARLDRVMDPELDESVLSLGFVESVVGDTTGNITVCLRLPTYWCAANFSYLMASDVRRELSSVEGVGAVIVRLGEHFASGEVERGSSFAEAFPNGGPDTLEETRQIFLRKAYFTRQERLLRELKRAGLSFGDIASLTVGNLAALPTDPQVAARYMERRGDLGLDCSDLAPLIVDVKGAAIPQGEIENYYVRARTTRLAMEASGSLCSAMLQARNSNRTPSKA